MEVAFRREETILRMVLVIVGETVWKREMVSMTALVILQRELAWNRHIPKKSVVVWG